MAKKTTRPRDEKGRFIKVQQPEPQPIQSKTTNEKKSEGGKKRASTGIRNERGQYVSKIFANEIKKTLLATKRVDVSKVNADQSTKIDSLLKDAKVTPLQVKKFYEKNKEIFEDLKTFGKLKGTSKNSNQIEKGINEYKGKVFINDGGKVKEVSKSEAKLQLIKFKSFLSSNINVVDFTLKPTFDIDGKMTLNLPDPKKLLKDLKTYFGVTTNDELEEFSGVEIMEALEQILSDMYGEESDLTIYAS